MKKTISLFTVISLIAYNLIPLVNTLLPDAIATTFLLDLWITNSLYALVSATFMRIKYGFKIWAPLLIPILFVPTMFIFYNTSASIFVAVYFVFALMGTLIGSFVHKTRKAKA